MSKIPIFSNGIVKPLQTIKEPARDVPVVWDGDVVVCGGGPAGIMAALASARSGAKTLLIERYGFMGGTATNSLMFVSGTFTNGERLVIQGIPLEFLQNNMGIKNVEEKRWIHLDAEVYKRETITMLKQAGCDILFHTWTTDTIKDGSNVRGVYLQNKSGHGAVLANVTIDTTGDGDLIPSSGAGYNIGRDKDGLCLPMSSVFQMANVDIEKYRTYAYKGSEKNESGCSLQNIWRKGLESGEIDVPLLGFIHLMHIGHDMCNVHATRVTKKQSTNGWEFSEAEIETRRQAWQICDFLIKRVPGFENSFMYNSAAQIGVREGRRLKGAYVLNDDDLLNARKFDDVIACGCYNIDLHNPDGNVTVHIPIPEDDWYDIPYRSLYASGIDGFLTAGRCISGTHEAHGSYRLQSHAMAIGQAAGSAAALASRSKTPVQNLDVKQLQNVLREQNAFLGE